MMGSVAVLACLFLLLRLNVFSDACPRSTHQLSCGKCVAIIATRTQSAATSECSSSYTGGELLTLSTPDELRIVRRYAAVFNGSGDYWVGYRYNGTTLINDGSGVPAETIVSQEVTGGMVDDNCLVLKRDGSFEGQSCTEMQQSLCLFTFTSLLPTISVSPNPVTANRPASFSCIFQNSTAPDTVTFFRGGDPVDFGSVTISSTSAELTIPSFTSRLDGSYECRISVGAETAVSRVIRASAGANVPLESAVTPMINGSAASNGPNQVDFGTPLNLSCSFTSSSSSSRVEWYINGLLTNTNITTATDGTSSSLYLSAVSTAGVYQCRISNADGSSGIGSIVLCGSLAEATPPGPVNIFAVPKDKTSLSITIVPPGNTIDSLLTPISIFYNTSRYASSNDASSRMDLAIDSSATGRGEYLLTNLSPGERYWVSAQAKNMMGMIGEEAPFLTLADTFGNAPSTAPEELSLVVTTDNTALLADWKDVEPTRPVGPLAFYDVEFTSSRQGGVVNALRIDPDFSFSVITGIRGGNFYQVRVRSAVQVQTESDMFEYSPFTELVNVSGVIEPSNLPSTPPTVPTGPLSQEAVIAISVVVPVVIIVAVVIAVIVVFVIFWKIRSHKVDTDGGGDSQELKKVDPNEKDEDKKSHEE